MRVDFKRINAALSRPAAGWWLLGIVVLGYALAYRLHSLFPGYGTAALTSGWWSWSDQQRYLAEAAAIATGRLDAQSYQYPIGYPALGAVFWHWMPAHPFFWPNLALIVGSAAAWWRLARRWLEPLECLVVAALLVGTHRWLLADTMVVPWNTLPTQLALLTGIWLVLDSVRWWSVWALSGLAAAAYVTRPIDAVPFLPLLLFATLRRPRARDRWWHGAVGATTLAVAIAAIGLLNHGIFGSWRTPYETSATSTVGFFSYPFSYKLFWLLIDGRPLFHETDPALLFRYPWLFLAIPAACQWLVREGVAAAAGLTALLASWFVYLNYNDFLPSDVYRFTLIHYLAWTFPLLFLLVAVACRHGWRHRPVRMGWLAALMLVVVAAGLRLDERAVLRSPRDSRGWPLPEIRPLLVRYPGVSRSETTRLRIDGQPLIEYSEYLTPYVGDDLQFLLSARRTGVRLRETEGRPLPAPEFTRYVWTWRLNPGRIKRLGR